MRPAIIAWILLTKQPKCYRRQPLRGAGERPSSGTLFLSSARRPWLDPRSPDRQKGSSAVTAGQGAAVRLLSPTSRLSPSPPGLRRSHSRQQSKWGEPPQPGISSWLVRGAPSTRYAHASRPQRCPAAEHSGAPLSRTAQGPVHALAAPTGLLPESHEGGLLLPEESGGSPPPLRQPAVPAEPRGSNHSLLPGPPHLGGALLA
ncbi:hypothetical protein NDU88_009379 [Pleurodeles waltl]|uniref:Uncharacterized protein n=1 Tax=Pleurodeles waltl TaxID=8319 RepID=A0AAV7QRD8_PLEWA|nr:hypothetical protein NDU88_009379 [Pleurodeles waltl]